MSGSARMHRGFTLPEIIIGAVLLSLLITLIATFLVPSLRVSVICSTRADIQQEALRAEELLSSDMLTSLTAGIAAYSQGGDPETGPVYVGINPLGEVNALAQQIWKEELIVYSWEGKGKPLIRKVWTPSLPPSLSLNFNYRIPVKASESDLATIAGETSLGGRILARDVEEFKVLSRVPGSPSLTSPIEIFIRLSRKDATGKKDEEKFTYSRKITLRSEL